MRLALLSVIVLLAPLRAPAFETMAQAAWVYDMSTGTVLLNKDGDVPLPPASMSKLMTLYLAFEAVADGRLDIDAELPVSAHAASFGGSSMFLDTTDRVRVEDLLRGVVVLSGNDASVVLAEALSPDGTEAGFARIMTERARAMGMTSTTLMNASGWPADGHVMSMHDLGILADRLIRDFPTFYPMFAEQEFLFDGRVPSNTQNRNPILGLDIGADGLKTGHTQEAGYGLVGSAIQGDRRIIFVITGLQTDADRRNEGERIVNWAFRQFAERDLGRAGDRLAEAEVWMGAVPGVGLVLQDDLRLLVPATGGDDTGLLAEVIYDGPIAAPVAAGTPIATLRITRAELPTVEVPLVAEATVPRGGFAVRMRTAIDVLWSRYGPQVAADTAETAPGGA